MELFGGLHLHREQYWSVWGRSCTQFVCVAKPCWHPPLWHTCTVMWEDVVPKGEHMTHALCLSIVDCHSSSAQSRTAHGPCRYLCAQMVHWSVSCLTKHHSLHPKPRKPVTQWLLQHTAGQVTVLNCLEFGKAAVADNEKQQSLIESCEIVTHCSSSQSLLPAHTHVREVSRTPCKKKTTCFASLRGILSMRRHYLLYRQAVWRMNEAWEFGPIPLKGF